MHFVELSNGWRFKADGEMMLGWDTIGKAWRLMIVTGLKFAVMWNGGVGSDRVLKDFNNSGGTDRGWKYRGTSQMRDLPTCSLQP